MSYTQLTLLLSLRSVQNLVVRCAAGLLSVFEKRENGERLERIRYLRTFEDVLRQCQETMKNFEGSEETLRHIQRVEESLKRLVAETN